MTRTFTRDELKEILDSHSRWLSGLSDGRRADLTRAHLTGAHLTRAHLAGAHLAGADLTGAHLTGAHLAGANLAGANLAGADLTGAHLAGANLAGADLTGAHLAGANLAGADLTRANLTRANLTRAHLAGAHLAGADLAGADLAGAKDDLFTVLDAAPAEVPALLDTLRAGRVDGSTYVGECACLVGTIANVRGVSHRTIPNLAPNSNRPAERLFLAIRKGDTPDNHQIAKIVADWIVEWQAKQTAQPNT